jgi:hypothetical protein
MTVSHFHPPPILIIYFQKSILMFSYHIHFGRFPNDFPHLSAVCMSYSCIIGAIPADPNFLDSTVRTYKANCITSEVLQVYSILNFPLPSSFLVLKIFVSTLISDTCNLCSPFEKTMFHTHTEVLVVDHIKKKYQMKQMDTR